MSKVIMTTTSQRLNLRALIILTVLSVIGGAGLYAGKVYKEEHGGSKRLLVEAKKHLERKQPQLALRYLSEYLKSAPGDLDAMELKAKVLADTATNEHQAIEAMKIHNQILGAEPENPKWNGTRRRLAELNLRVWGRGRAAEALARKMIKLGANDAKTHRLLANALEQIGIEGDAEAIGQAREEYEIAERQEPGDVTGAERLALLYRDKLGDPQKASQILDDLVKFNQKSPKTLALAYLARAHFYYEQNQGDRGLAEIEQALKADPQNLIARLAAAEGAAQRGDTSTARQHLNAIAAADRGDLRIKLIEGLIDLTEQRSDEAILNWRTGLLQTGGNDADLTWRLAHVLLDLGRVRDAEPLVSQYRRLSGGDEGNPRYHYLHAFYLLKTNQPAEAITELEANRYKVDKPLTPHLYLVLGRCFEATHDRAKALAAYRQSAELAHDWSAPYMAIAAMQQAEQSPEAVATLEQGLTANPDDPRLLVALAQMLWQRQVQLPAEKRSWGGVERVIEHAKKVAPGSVELALAEADYLMAVARTDDALALLQSASKLNPRSLPLWIARINGLTRVGKTAEAMTVLDQATAEAGPQASFVVTKAWLLFSQGHVKAARAALTEGVDRVSAEQKPVLWKALGDFHSATNDLPSARGAFEEWAKLRPESPEPRAALFDLALASGDEKAIRAAVDALKNVGGPQAPFWRVARVQELLRDDPKTSASPARDARRLDEAERLIKEVERNAPQLSLGPLLEARLLERRHNVDDAIHAYERALDLKAGSSALNPLMALLVREHRDADLARLRQKMATMSVDLERLAATQAVKLGDKAFAEQMAAQLVKGNPQGAEARLWQAQMLRSVGKPKEAEAAFRLLIQQHPEDPSPYVQLLLLQTEQKQTKEAAETIDQIRARVKTDRPELLWAQCYRLTGDLRQADQYYHEALKRWPSDVAVASSAVGYFDQTGRPGETEAVLRLLLKQDPALGWATRKLALLLSARASDHATWDEALKLIGPTARPDDTPEDRLVRATVYSRGVEPAHRQLAVKILEDLAADQPGSSAVHEMLARLLYLSGQSVPARAHAAQAAGENATPEAILLYAGTLIDSDKLAEAEAQLDRLIAIDPKGLPVAELRARILAAKGRGKEGAAGLERAFDERAHSPEGVSLGEKMVRVLVQLNLLDAAERVARKVGDLGPQGSCVLAQFLASRGRLDEAAPLIEAAAKAGDIRDAAAAALVLASSPGSDPRWLALADQLLDTAMKKERGSVDLTVKLATLRHFQNRHDDEMKLYQAALDLKPTNFLFLNNMAWSLSEDMNRPEEALKRIDEALVRVGWHPHMLDTRGVILTRLKRFDDAIKDLETAAKALPTGPVYFHLARAYQKKGRTEDFQKYRDLARQTGLKPEDLQTSEREDWEKWTTP